MNRIAVLGDGITAGAVRAYLAHIGQVEVSPEHAEIMVVSPGIDPQSFPQVHAESVSEIEFAYRLIRQLSPETRIVAVTGTNGKSTLTSLLAHSFGVSPFGNIGKPLIEALMAPEIPSILVVEVSSYQLECSPTFAPDVAILINLTPDHLKRHRTLDAYYTMKERIFLQQTPSQKLFYLEEELEVVQRVQKAHSHKIKVTTAALPFLHPLLVGKHNVALMRLAYAVLNSEGHSDTWIWDRWQTFVPLPHRLEKLHTTLPFDVFNDSKSTNIASTQVALEAFQVPIHLILCGEDKGLDLEPLCQVALDRASTVSVFGQMVPLVVGIMSKRAPGYPLFTYATLDEAVEATCNRAQSGEVVLFSPGSSSYDQFNGFEDRGRCFKQCVKQYETMVTQG